MKAKNFLLLQCLVVVVVIGGWLGLYWIYDPLGFFNSPRFSFASKKKLSLRADAYLTTPLQIYFHQPEVLILGNSMAGMGFTREQFPRNRKVANAAVFGSKPYTWLRLLQNAKAVNKNLDTVYLILDLTEMNPEISKKEQRYRDAFEERLLFNEESKFRVTAIFSLVLDLLELIVSLDGYENFYDYVTAKNDISDYADAEGFHYYPSEQQNVELRRAERILSTKILFDASFVKTREYDALRKMIAYSYRNNIDLIIILPPYHASFYQALAGKEKLDVLIEWKNSLFEVNQDLFIQHLDSDSPHTKRTKAFDIFDFSRYSDLTRDQYVLSGQKIKTSMYYYDVNHFNHLVGDKILEDVMHPDDLKYSRLLTKETLDSMRDEMQHDQAQFSMLYY